MLPHEWDACTWDLQRTYFEGLVAEGLLNIDEDPADAAAEQGMTRRTADVGTGVFDLSAMRDELAAGQ